MSLLDKSKGESKPASAPKLQSPQQPAAAKTHPMAVISWPDIRRPAGVGMSVKDGWNFGIGMGLAFAVAVPLILTIVSCFFWMLLLIFGSALGAMLGG
jgi:hypothetical protein